jgi:hypothetical protein
MLLKEGVSKKQPGKGQRHKVFEESFDAKPVYHRKFPAQKINYIHLNLYGENGDWLNIGRTMNTAVWVIMGRTRLKNLPRFIWKNCRSTSNEEARFPSPTHRAMKENLAG